MIFSISTTMTTFATDRNLTGVLPEKVQMIEGAEIQSADTSNQEKVNNNQVNAESGYENTKAVAIQKASSIINDYGSTSVQYALIDNGKIVLSGNSGVYSKEDNTALTADTMYGTGSVSKMFVTTAVMNLVDKGKIELDAPITKYIKEFKMKDKRYKKITVRMLLNHSSGIMGTSIRNSMLFGDNDSFAHDTLLKQLRSQRLKADPGAYCVYCNDGFHLSEILVERVTGMSYTDYITNTILNPLKMNNTKTPRSSFDRNRLAKAYAAGISNPLPEENTNDIGSGGVYSSAEDLCVFATTFMKNSNGLLTEKSRKEMENKEYLKGIWPKDTNNILGYGLGWDCVNLYPFNQYNIKALNKGGDTAAYHSSFMILPEQNMALAVVSSGGVSSYNMVMAQEILLNALKEKGIISQIKPDKTFHTPQKETVPETMKKYEGLYVSRKGLLDIKIDECGTLSINSHDKAQQGTETYVYTKDGTFVSQDGAISLKFVDEKNGRTYLQQTEYGTIPSLGQTVSDLYIAQKENGNDLSEMVSVWAKRNGKNYYLLNEKYSSSLYLTPYYNFQVNLENELGYLISDILINKIENKKSAISILDGPGTLSRDLYDVNFYKKNKFEYLKSGDSIFIEEDAIKTLSTKNKFKCTIGKKGYAKWYKIGSGSAGKEITVDSPKNSSFVVYDNNGALVNNSWITGNTKVILPKNGKIVFLGNASTKFNIQYK
ncbi:class A beta-lactamase-related serine hydrolase [Anaerosacchariphilus polymeriproducens]|uniref:Class A beta-lactamase-related serine hydrolase n=2 Tax=Anaerosacchariphilus polymeriproducens TaxID=1812858 RepID=A0A371AWX9_9FIRM|nr:class A beta-lactamase-related serine hydrolase [Anaerosacchariphilus polymeriproducens]